MEVLEQSAAPDSVHPMAIRANPSAEIGNSPSTASPAFSRAAARAPVRIAASENLDRATPSNSLPGQAERAEDPLSQALVEQLRDTELWRSRIRVASFLCLIVFWGAVVYFVVFLLGSISILAEARRSEERASAVGLLFIALVAGGMAVLTRFAGHANRRCQRWAPLTMFIVEALGVVSAMIMGVILAFDGGVIALILMWIAAFLPGIFAAMFYRSWAAIPEYLSKPAWCRRTLEYCGL